MKLRKKTVILSVIGAAFLIIESLNFTGFCYAESRWLTAEQIKYRLVTEEWRKEKPRPSDAEIEKRAKASERFNCVSVEPATIYSPFSSGGDLFFWERIWLRLFGRGYYSVHTICPFEDLRYRTDARYAYEGSGYIDACASGGNKSKSSFVEHYTKEEYQKRLMQLSK